MFFTKFVAILLKTFNDNKYIRDQTTMIFFSPNSLCDNWLANLFCVPFDNSLIYVTIAGKGQGWVFVISSPTWHQDNQDSYENHPALLHVTTNNEYRRPYLTQIVMGFIKWLKPTNNNNKILLFTSHTQFLKVNWVFSRIYDLNYSLWYIFGILFYTFLHSGSFFRCVKCF